MATKAQRVASEYNWKLRQLEGTYSIMRNIMLQAQVPQTMLNNLLLATHRTRLNLKAKRDNLINAAKEEADGNS